jgi:branched-chain amino acid transport system permease protein
VEQFLQYTAVGLVLAAVYAVSASGLVVTYTTSGIFNFAHGAVGMVSAFAYWQLTEAWGLPPVVGIALILLVVAPAFGALLDLVIMRGLEGTSEVTKTVVTVGVLFSLIYLAPAIWPQDETRFVPPFFSGENVSVVGVNVSYHQIVVILVAVAVAAFLRLVLFRTRSGVAMRAVVSNRSLVQLVGGRPGRSSALSWALGSSLAALAGILVAEKLGLEVFSLALLAFNAYAAAIVGRLVSLPLTFLGAVILGLAESWAVGYLPGDPSWLPDGWSIIGSIGVAVPTIVLFVVLLLLPNAPLRAHGITRIREKAPKPSMRSALIAAVALVVVAFVVSRVLLSPSTALPWGKGFGFALMMLSLVPLTGWGGQISLAQISFAGIGAVSMGVWGVDGNPLGLVLAFVVPALVGAIVALPALRLRGIYLALATFAFAVFISQMVFFQTAVMPAGSRAVDRPELFGLSLDGNQEYFVFMAVVFALAGLLVVWLRLGPFGRRLQAMKDSPAACATLGLNLTTTKLQVFALSAGIAGVGGAMFASLGGTTVEHDWNALQGLPILLLAVAGGIALVSGALIGGFMYASLTELQIAFPAMATLFLIGPGLIGISLGRNPNGIASAIILQSRRLLDRASYHRPEGEAERGPLFPGVDRVYDVEELGISRPFTDDDLARVDRALAFDAKEVEASGTPVR